MTTNEMLAAIEDLRQRDHSFVSPEYANRIGKVFGFKPKLQWVAGSDTPKGLQLPRGQTHAQGADAEWLARQICHHLGVDYEFSFGRGQGLRNCCDALEAHIKTPS